MGNDLRGCKHVWNLEKEIIFTAKIYAKQAAD